MIESNITMSPEHLAGTLAVTRQRERKRCLAAVTAVAEDYPEGSPERLALDRAARDILGATPPLASEPVGDGLPPVRHHDDFDEGVAMVRARR